ncbi:sensor domain-containing protein [Thermocatellispora tengchongensis]|uniref:sensor domain-containing protein n=1 Tax=Thermocatellispora tengchongensis TaxID=1073253 RepID=UPI0036449798
MLAACTALEAMTRAPLRFLRSPWPLRSLAYLLPSALLAVAGVGLAFTVYAYGPVAAGALGVAASLLGGLGLARFERWRLRLVDLEPARDPHRPPGGPGCAPGCAPASGSRPPGARSASPRSRWPRSG